MKLLKIEESQGHYYANPDKYITVDKLTKEALLMLVNLTLENDIELDEYDEEKIKHQAHQVIYKSVFEKLRDLSQRKQEFRDEAERLYLEEYEKYQGE